MIRPSVSDGSSPFNRFRQGESSMAAKTASKKTNGKKSTTKKPIAVSVFQLRMPFRRAIEVEHLVKPPTYVQPKKIHSRNLLPLIREGMEREFHSQSSEAFLRPLIMATPLAAMAPLAASDELTLVTNTELPKVGQQKTASNVGEPSVAVNGNVVFFSGNWYAAVSSDSGKTFQFIDPNSAFKDPSANSHFCCDQVVHYISKIDTFVWLLQYGPDTGDNIQRLAFAKTADVVQGRWRLFDLTTAMLGVPGAFLDFPDLAVGANHLYVTTNIFQGADQAGSGVLRIPIAEIKSGGIIAKRFVSMELQSFRVAQSCGPTAYF